MPYFTTSQAVEVFQSLISAARICLDHLKIPREPSGKMRAWESSGGPIGLLYHYTGGVNGVSTARWFNDPAWGNADSSCHCLILDRVISELESIWPKQEAASLFPVPTLLLAPLNRATWHGNWSNSKLFGVENRNAGYSGYQKRGGLGALGKAGVKIGGRVWEVYTREQIVCNIQLGRLWAALRGSLLRPDWICGHSQIWGTKLDPGPAFPTMDEMRGAIWGSADPLWLARYPHAISGEEPEATPVDHRWGDVDRKDGPEGPSAGAGALAASGWLPGVAEGLWRLGWPTGPEMPPDGVLREMVVRFQRSTAAWAGEAPSRVLAVDGVPGPKTREALRLRLREMKLP